MGMCGPAQALKAEWPGGEDPCPTNSFSKAPPQTAFSPHSLPAPKCPSNSFSVSAMNPGSLSHCAIPTTAASHLGGEGGGCAATLHPSALCLSMLWTMMLQHGSLGAVKTLASPPVKFLPSWSRHSRSQPPCLGRAEWLGLGGMVLPPSWSQATATTPAHNTFHQLLTSRPSNQERGEAKKEGGLLVGRGRLTGEPSQIPHRPGAGNATYTRRCLPNVTAMSNCHGGAFTGKTQGPKERY
ncbi:unnamed protein product [Scomber scombrus]|uniref:Unnamed protein product n=1 Tax=Scomber scombrus TaxID=13677 RepID=A0AAV1NCV1_SCOSC